MSATAYDRIKSTTVGADHVLVSVVEDRMELVGTCTDLAKGTATIGEPYTIISKTTTIPTRNRGSIYEPRVKKIAQWKRESRRGFRS